MAKLASDFCASRELLASTLPRSAVALMAAAAMGCGGGLQKQVRGATFDLSGNEAGLADEYEREEPGRADARARCAYWDQRTHDAEGSHTIGVISWPAEYFETLRHWAEAKRAAVCERSKQEDSSRAVQSAAFLPEPVPGESCGSPVQTSATLYLKKETGLLMSAGLRYKSGRPFVPNDVSEHPNLFEGFPGNTKLEVLRGLPGEDGECTYVEVRPANWNGRTFTFAVRADQLTDTPQSDDEMRAEQEARSAAIQKRLDTEIELGRCDARHVEYLRSVLEGSKQLFSSQTGSPQNPDVWDLVSQKLIVATENPGEFTLDTGVGGELHVFALGFAPTKLAVNDAQGYPVNDPSRYSRALVEFFHLKTVGLRVRTNRGDQLRGAVFGRGCVLVFAMRKL